MSRSMMNTNQTYIKYIKIDRLNQRKTHSNVRLNGSIFFMICLIFFFLVGTTSLTMAQNARIDSNLELNYESNPDNPQIPQFVWQGSRGATYFLYIDGELIYEGRATRYPNASVSNPQILEAGEHTAYLRQEGRAGEAMGPTLRFTIDSPSSNSTPSLSTSSNSSARENISDTPVPDMNPALNRAVDFSVVQNDPDRLEVFVYTNPSDIKHPIFYWQSVKDANYNVYLNGEFFGSPEQNYYIPVDELAYGYYQIYILVSHELEREKGPITEFNVGMTSPELIYPENKTIVYSPIIPFKWSSVVGATGYELYLNEDMIYDGPAPTYDFEASEEDYTTLKFRVIAKNEFQRIASDRAMFKLDKLIPPNGLAPENHYSIVMLASEDIPTLSWEPVDMPEEFIRYELYLAPANKPEELKTPVYTGTETEYRPEDLKIGAYVWQVKSICHQDGEILQESPKTPKQHFELKDRTGIYMGVKIGLGPAFDRETDVSPRINPCLGAYIEKRFGKSTSLVQFRLELDIMYTKKSVNYEFTDAFQDVWTQSFRYDNAMLSIPILLKLYFHGVGTEKLDIYPYIGPGLEFLVFQRLVSDDNSVKQSIDPNTVPMKRGIFIFSAGIGFSITLDAELFPKQKLQILGDIRLNSAVSKFIPESNRTFFGNSASINVFSIMAGIKLFEF